MQGSRIVMIIISFILEFDIARQFQVAETREGQVLLTLIPN
jgi:hypothetical protein